MTGPRVFIGIPTFNRPTMVCDAIRSIVAQEMGDWRAIVSDNCSDGDAADQVERFVLDLGDPRLSFHRQASNGGEYGQGRFFLQASEGAAYIAILHDDDVMLPRYLSSGVAALDAAPEADVFVANAFGAGPDGRRDDRLTREWLRAQGRLGASAGTFDVLSRHLETGFAPISGTLMRRSALERSGFVDADLSGNYPFEANVFLRLGEVGARGIFLPQELLGMRLHPGALRNQGIMRDPRIVASCVALWSRRRFSGRLERRRRVLLSRYQRAEALLALAAGDVSGARRALTDALKENPMSVKAWMVRSLLFAAPGMLRATLRAQVAA